MNAITMRCRFCLQDCEDTFELTPGCVIINKVLLCFSIRVMLSNHLPNSICKMCSQKIDEFLAFRKSIIESENILLNNIHQIEDTYTDISENYTNDDNDIEIGTNLNETFQNIIPAIKLADSIGNKQLEKVTRHCKEIPYVDMKSKNEVSSLERIDENDNTSYGHNEIQEKSDKDNIGTLDTRCLMCLKSYPNRSSLLKHYLTEERIRGQPLSDKEFNLKVEVKSDGIDKVYVCLECKMEFKSKCLIDKHLNSHNIHYICKICGRMYHRAVDILNHGKSHSDIKMYCSYSCGYSTSYLHLMKNHEKIHNNDYKFTCKQCGKGFQVRTWYEQHQNIHKGIKQYVCDICGAGFHMHRYLTAHTSAMHADVTNKKRYACLHCSLTFGSKNSLTIHLQEHGFTSEYLCDGCGKVFMSSRQLSHHRRTHSNEKPYKCRTCNKTFPKKFNMLQHESTHTNTRFSCTKCTASFKQRSSLNRHTASKHATEDSKKT
ncbi:zinc finger protein OZF-like [Leptidea sinapis]|uniref:zinc finger protein OZF-like n=1 Tax=Leptidea sinapis TaxID=189913 RepID=UPI00213A9D6B|nr:zinc finger protein OZF-like [Leptidea sinapis]